MLDAVVSFVWPEGMADQTIVKETSHKSSASDQRPELIFETTDGFITAGAMSNKEWEGLGRALEQPQWLEDPRFQTPADRMKHAPHRLELMSQVIRTRSTDEWINRLDAEEVPCAPVLRRDEVRHNEQVIANNLIVESEHPHVGRTRMPRPPARFTETPAELRIHAPALGEHTESVLKEFGVTPAEFEQLEADDII